MILSSIFILIWVYFVYYSPWHIKSDVNCGTSFWWIGSEGAGFMSLSMPFDQHSSAICLRLKSYLVVKISSDIVNEHCCQVGVLSKMFCHSDCRLCDYKHISDCAIKKLEYHMVWLHPDRSTWEMIWRNILYIWLSHFTLIWERHISARVIPCHCISINKDSQWGQCWLI